MYHRAHPRAEQSGLLQGGFGSSVGEGLPDRHVGPPARNVRSEDAEIHADQHLLPHPPRPVRLRQGQHGVGERGRPRQRRGRLGQHARSRRDRRRGEGARLDAVHPRHQRRRQARRIHRTEPAVRPGQGPPHQRGVLRRVAGPATARCGAPRSAYPGYVVRLDPTKPNPSSTALAEVYEVPAPGYGPRGFDIDSKGVAWVPLSSGHMASFDRSKCKVLNGPTIRDGKALPGRLDALSAAGSQARGRSGHRFGRGELLHLGRPARRSRPRQRRSVRHRQSRTSC